MKRNEGLSNGDIYVGVIGFGEVGSTFSNTMAERGAFILVHDSRLEQDEGKKELESRIHHEGIKLTTLDEVLSRSQIILSVVTNQMAEVLANQIAMKLETEQIYVDLNSTSPAVKIRICQIIENAGANFVEGAILGAIGAVGVSTHILLAGGRGEEVAKFLKNLGLNSTFYAADVGKASTFKMLRSIFSKGLEALILELMIAGRRAGIEGDLWKDIADFMIKNPFDRVAENWICTHVKACERRYHEMIQVVDTMREFDIDPVMSSSTVAFFKRSISFNFDDVFKEKPETYNPVIDFMERQLTTLD
ncbi:MAG: hypothetical protein A2Z14_16425 [Chloroflexi bacterium RBG_16_48_8]|nr:MAG: hypothetical protein A2Z14_16425 [Chloroflexi bacterium RBG_16_48_8]